MNESGLSAFDVSIVIVNYNGRHLLDKCLRSIYDTHGYLAPEIWIVDNGSTDGSVPWVRELYPQLNIIENEENYGFARANNQAIALCSGKYILLLNNDTIVKGDALLNLVQILDQHSSLAALGPMLLNQDGSVQPSCMHFPSIWRGPVNYLKTWIGGSSKYIASSTNSISLVDAVTGACMLIRREALEQIGLLDEEYFMYAEETDWCYRAYKLGWQIGYLPSAMVIHLGNQSAQREAARFYVERRYGRVRFYMKHRGTVVAWIETNLIRLNIMVKWMLYRNQRQEYANILHTFNVKVSSLFQPSKRVS